MVADIEEVDPDQPDPDKKDPFKSDKESKCAEAEYSQVSTRNADLFPAPSSATTVHLQKGHNPLPCNKSAMARS